jgi:hypothetical protein
MQGPIKRKEIAIFVDKIYWRKKVGGCLSAKFPHLTATSGSDNGS